MAKIVLGLGAAHTPLLTMDDAYWEQRSAADRANPALNLSDGRLLPYAALLRERGPRFESEVTPQILAQKARACAAALDRLAGALAAARPDVVVIVGDDQRELFDANNQPMLAVYHGEQVITHHRYGGDEAPEWNRQVGRGYLMDGNHCFDGAPELALDLIAGLLQRDVDVATVAGVADADKAAFGHAYGFIVQRLMGAQRVPVLPVLLNTYYPPNVPTARRAHTFGVALRASIEASRSAARVAVVASGGLSHFVVDEALDRGLLAALQRGDADALRAIPPEALQSGSSEILNWVMTAGAVAHLPLTWSDYQPLYRTPAGTGVGAGFATWGEGV